MVVAIFFMAAQEAVGNEFFDRLAGKFVGTAPEHDARNGVREHDLAVADQPVGWRRGRLRRSDGIAGRHLHHVACAPGVVAGGLQLQDLARGDRKAENLIGTEAIVRAPSSTQFMSRRGIG